MKRAANLSIDTKLLDEAKALKINLSRTLEAALQEEVTKSRAVQWRAENKKAIQDYNDWIEDNGLPLADYRTF